MGVLCCGTTVYIIVPIINIIMIMIIMIIIMISIYFFFRGGGGGSGLGFGGLANLGFRGIGCRPLIAEWHRIRAKHDWDQA